MSRGAPSWVSWVIATAVAVAAVLLLAIRGSEPTAAAAPPFAGAQRGTLAQASRHVGFIIAAPSAPLANGDTLSQVWYGAFRNDSGHYDTVAEVDYADSGIEIEYSRPTIAVEVIDPGEIYRRMAQTRGLNTQSVRLVHGVPALVSRMSNGKGSFVDLVLSNVHIVITGDQPESELIAVAESIPGPDRVAAPAVQPGASGQAA